MRTPLTLIKQVLRRGVKIRGLHWRTPRGHLPARPMRPPLPARMARRGPLAAAFALVAAAAMIAAPAAHAHVKWFSRFSSGDRPLAFADIVTPLVIGLALLSAVVVGVLVVLDRRLDGLRLYRRVNEWFDARRDKAGGILRAATGASLLLSWQADALLAPELHLAPGAWLGWAQFAVALLLVFRTTVPLAGVGLLGLFVAATVQHGLFHLLDYAVFAGVGYALVVLYARQPLLQASALPALYATTGFALCWLALEKLVYPGWAAYVVEQNPALTFGLDAGFFLTSAAFVEFSLGFLLVVGVLSRPLSAVITLVFFTTTLVFGKPEVIGHTILHGVLVVFLLEGPGRAFKPPIAIHRRTSWRVAFASVNLLLALGALLFAYTYSARRQYERAASDAPAAPARPAPPGASADAPGPYALPAPAPEESR